MSDRIKITFLGTNGWYDSGTGETTCVLVDAPSSYVIIDAGNAIRKADAFIKEDKPIFLFLGHLHLDHIYGLHILNKFNFEQGLTICCYRGGKALLEGLLDQPFTLPVDRLPFKLQIKELAEGKNIGFPFGLTARRVDHSPSSLLYRFEFKEGIVSYCVDTGYNRQAVELSRGADLVIAECTWLPGNTAGVWPHLNPEGAAGIAGEAKAKKLMLVHFDAQQYDSAGKRKNAEAVAQKTFKDTTAAYDGLEITV